MSTEKPEQGSAIGLADRLAAARKRTEKVTNGRPGVSKEDVAGGITTKSELFRRQLEILGTMDQGIDELGVQYGELVKVNQAIGRMSDGPCSGPNISQPTYAPSWIAEPFIAEVLRNRLAMELAEHSSGGGNETILGPVKSRATLLETFRKLQGAQKLLPGPAGR